MIISKNEKDFERIIQMSEVLQFYGYKNMGQEYRRRAIQAYENKMSAYDKGRIYYYLEDYQNAYIALEEAKDIGGAEAYLYLGLSYEATGDFNYASSVYKSFLNKGNVDVRIYNQLGLCELKKEEFSSALEAFQAGIKIDNNELKQTLLFNEIIAYEYLG